MQCPTCGEARLVRVPMRPPECAIGTACPPLGRRSTRCAACESAFCDECLPWPTQEAAGGRELATKAPLASKGQAAPPATAKARRKTVKESAKKIAKKVAKKSAKTAEKAAANHLSTRHPTFPKYWSEEKKAEHNREVELAIERGSGVEAFRADPGASLALESYLKKHWKNTKGVAVWRAGHEEEEPEYLTGYNDYHVCPNFKAQVQERNTLMANTPYEFEKFYAIDGARQLEDSVRLAIGLNDTPLLAMHVLRQSKATTPGTGFADHRDDEEDERKVRSPPSILMQHTLHLLSLRGTPKRHPASIGVPVCWQRITAIVKLTGGKDANQVIVHSAQSAFTYGSEPGAGGFFKSKLVHRSGRIGQQRFVFKVAFFFA